MNYYTKIEDINKYLEKEAVNQSFLKMVLANNVKPFKQTVSMIIGTVYDSMLTSPHLTKELFSVGLGKRPSETIKTIVDEMYVEYKNWLTTRKSYSLSEQPDPEFEDYKSEFIMKARIANYNKNWGDEAIWNAIKKDGESYWNELIKAGDKLIVTQEEWDRCFNLYTLTLNSSITGKYFLDQSNIEKYFQLPLYWKYNNIECKGLLDLLLFEEETKTIYYIDIKTTGVNNLSMWFEICKNKRYEFQMAWYYEGIVSNYLHLIEDGWKIKMRWMVIPSQGNFKPWIIPVTKNMLYQGKSGSQKIKNSYQVETEISHSIPLKGWIDAFSIYRNSLHAGLNDYDYEWFSNNGKLNYKLADKMFFN